MEFLKHLRVVGFLQNAWSPLYAGGTWPRPSWLRALHACHSGRRLALLTAATPGVDWWFDNTTPLVGATPSSVVPADLGYMRSVLDAQAPDVIVAFGCRAHAALLDLGAAQFCLDAPLLVLPHPAARLLKRDLYDVAAAEIRVGLTGVVEYAIRDNPAGYERRPVSRIFSDSLEIEFRLKYD